MKYALIIYLLVLTACEAKTSVGLFPPRFDSVEYSYVSDARWALSHVDCVNDPTDTHWWYSAQENMDKLTFFSDNQPNDKAVNDSGYRLYKIVVEYITHENPSVEYCKLKKISLDKALKELGHQMALEPRN